MQQDRIDLDQIQWEGPVAEDERRQAQRDNAGIRSSSASAASTEAGLPYVVPEKKTGLARTKQQITISGYDAVDKLRDQFESNKDYQRYAVTIPALTAALSTAGDPEGDIALTYYAAKIFDPDSAVREGEQENFKAAASTLERVQARIRKEFGLEGGGNFSEENRQKLRQELIKRSKTLNDSYNRVRTQYTRLAERRGYLPDEVVGDHLGAPHMPALKSYDEKRKTASQGAAPDTSRGTFDPLMGNVPDGATVSGEDVKGFRFKPDQETRILNYIGSKDFTPEGFAELIAAEQSKAAGVEVSPARYLQEAQRISKLRQEGGVPSTFNYSAVDKSATEHAGPLESAQMTLENLPESTTNVVKGLIAPVTDLAKSIEAGSAEGLYETVPALAAGLLSKAGIVDADESTVNALSQAMVDRYGGLEEIKRTLVTDPAGLVGDLSLVLTGGGSAAARAPGVVGKVGQSMVNVGRAIDPLAATATVATRAPRIASEYTPQIVKDIAKAAPSGIPSIPSGIGGDTVREAFKAGRSRGKAGAPTTQSDAFIRALRDSGATAEEVVSVAQGAVGELRKRASDAYQQAMQQFGRNPVPLDLDQIRQSINAIRPENYNAMLNAPTRPTKHVAWERMDDLVEHYISEAAKDPELATPLRVDQFKQDLYDVGAKTGGAFDRDAARIASTAYNAVKDLLTSHDPVYADIMKDYERAAHEVQQMESSFSLASARGKRPNLDTATRKLQSIFRNNAHSNYGLRIEQGRRVGDIDPTGTLQPLLAGETASAWRPRSLSGSMSLGGTIGAAGMFGVPLSPTALASLPLLSPRVVGESAYGLGRATGTTERALGPLVDAGTDAAAKLYAKYQDNPAVALSVARGGNYERDREQRKRDEMLRRYGIEALPSIDEDVGIDALGRKYL